ncbi:hypothetical protein [Tepidibacillus fermentans]|uniref:Uncharacterized protein n=1 Tax=Tepidibacillus fermentans TaxID=1281767 RepID=A0A4R3K703_9BACI|nr:hypothetical protein [Tepidibacillus fermentans]TCS78461.1 hypothetical protein EDD72_1275 [Tepidibacillus fermentans]
MFTIRIKDEYMNSLFFDGLDVGKSHFVHETNDYVGTVSDEEFDQFMKNNNLIVYRNLLKLYENGEVIGTFSVRD